MSLDEYKHELQAFLENSQSRDFRVVVMPDFFLDRIVDLQWRFSEFSGSIKEIMIHKGGSIDGIIQVDQKGGNSINTASALLSLGVSVTPIICTSKYGCELIKYHFKDTAMDLSHVKTVGKASITTALEFMERNEKINVMLRDIGALADFGLRDLDEKDHALIADVDYVCLFNWAGTKNHGTALAQAVFERTKQGRGKTYYDTADPTPNATNIPGLIEKVLKSDQIDVLSLNENEAITYACMLEADFRDKRGRLSFADYAMEAARMLARCFSARIDLHTTSFSASLKGTHEVVVPTFKIEVLRATGAGDAWNAGNLLADFNGLSDGGRLMLANTVSACYLSSTDGTHPTKAKVAGFLKTIS
ncbi:MAG: carbohydrate kinase family protein [Nitrososphaerota archaeon]|jgi:sugar/nucleoside kinase (ribokinase family)|nr:carbohydrate kinase family protein [Nitrososphaerota archaeon]